MVLERGCKYCDQSKELFEVAYRVVGLGVSELYLFRDQTYRGRCIVALREHRRELFELPESELEAFARDLARAAAGIKAVFGPAKLNYGAFGDKAPHFHVHLVPKYEGGMNWGEAFLLAPPHPVFLSEAEYAGLAAELRAAL